MRLLELFDKVSYTRSMFEDKDLNTKLDKIASKALEEIASDGEISKESCIELDEAMASLITQSIKTNEEIDIIPEEDVKILKRTRGFLLENPGLGGEDPYGAETARIMYTYITTLEIMNEEHED